MLLDDADPPALPDDHAEDAQEAGSASEVSAASDQAESSAGGGVRDILDDLAADLDDDNVRVENPQLARDEQEFIPPPPPPDPEDEVAAARDLLSSSRFGSFTITPKQAKGPGNFGGYQGSCRFHKKNNLTGCKRFVSIKGPTSEDREAAFDQILYWCTQARDFNRQRWHIGTSLQPTPSRALLARRIDEIPEDVQDDDELDRANAVAARPAAAKRKAKPKASKAKPKARGKAKAAAAPSAPSDEAASDPPSDSSDDSDEADQSASSSDSSSSSSSTSSS